jgi:hypothetical protein
MTLAAFNGTPVLNDGKVEIRSFGRGSHVYERAASNRKNCRDILNRVRVMLPHLRVPVKKCEE